MQSSAALWPLDDVFTIHNLLTKCVKRKSLNLSITQESCNEKASIIQSNDGKISCRLPPKFISVLLVGERAISSINRFDAHIVIGCASSKTSGIISKCDTQIARRKRAYQLIFGHNSGWTLEFETGADSHVVSRTDDSINLSLRCARALQWLRSS